MKIIPRTSVKLFAIEMEKILQQNDYKGGWNKCSIAFLRSKLAEEYGEYLISDDHYELVDIANICMMLYERLNREVKE